MQVVTFAPIPKTKPPEYIPTVLSMYRYLRDHEPDFKEFKRYLREHDLFDTDTFDDLMEFIQIKAVKGKPITIGNFLPALADKETLEEQQKALFRHLSKKNEILIKYVMDGLAERLYSTNELYRYITSYVYPGDYITLHHFKAWVEWLQATGHIKMIGIRWGLSGLGEDAMSYIKTIDVEDILEEAAEAAGGAGGDDEDDLDEDEPEGPGSWDAVGSPSDSAAPHEAVAAEAAAEAGAAVAERGGEERRASQAMRATDPDEERQASRAVRSEPQPGASQAGAYYALAGEPQAVMSAGVETVQVVVQPIATRPDETPLKLVRESFAAADEEEEVDEMTGEPSSALESRLEALRLDEDLVAENLRAVLSWWQGGARGRLLRASDYGFDRETYEAEPAFTLYRLACLAVSLFRHQGRLNVGKGGEAFGLLDQMGFFANAFKSRKSIDKTLDELFGGGLSQRPELFGNLHYFLLFRRTLKGLGDSGVTALAERGAPADVVGALWQHLGQHSLHYEILWIARELHVLGAWPDERLAALGVVPLPRARENAFRLGFIETPYAADFPSLVGISRRLSRFFGASEGFEAPLVFFEPERFVRYGTAEPAFFTREQLGID